MHETEKTIKFDLRERLNEDLIFKKKNPEHTKEQNNQLLGQKYSTDLYFSSNTMRHKNIVV